jgi:DNA-binding sugar fermentation-stimulating protein
MTQSSRRRKSSRNISRQSSTQRKDDECVENNLLLLDIGPLVKGKLIKRPSASIKSPYVSDVILLSETGEELESVLAHSPALDVGGLCTPESVVFLSKRDPGGKTSHSIELILAPGPDQSTINDDGDPVLIGSHPSLGEKIAEEVLKRGLLKDVIGLDGASLVPNDKLSSPSKKKQKKDDHVHDTGTKLYRQRTYGDSRVDFEIESVSDDGSSKKYLIEVKNVVCSDYAEVRAPVKTGANHCVIIAKNDENSTYKRAALFPWGRVGQTFEGKKVVSERAIKHLRNLADLGRNCEETQAVVLFVTNRSDCETMRPCDEACPVFTEELVSAASKGCMVVSVRVRWTQEGKAYFDGIIPVTLPNQS